MPTARMLAGLLATLALLATGAAGARDALDRDALVAGEYPHSVDLSAYGPPAGARPPSHRLEGRLHLSGPPPTPPLPALDDSLGPGHPALPRRLPQALDVSLVRARAVITPDPPRP